MGVSWFVNRLFGDNTSIPFYDGITEIYVKDCFRVKETSNGWQPIEEFKDEYKETTAYVRFYYRPFEDRWSFPNAITDLNGKCYNFKDLHPMNQTRINREVNRVTGEWRKTKGAPKRKTKSPVS